jgi:hypothetical protein
MKEHQAQILSIAPTKSEQIGEADICIGEPMGSPIHVRIAGSEEHIDSPIQLRTSPIMARTDLKKIITLNDRFLFCRELFSNDEKRMNRTIADLNQEESFEASMDYIKSHFEWNFEDDHVADFITCLKKSFADS